MLFKLKNHLLSPEILISFTAIAFIIRLLCCTVDSSSTITYTVFFGFLIFVIKALENRGSRWAINPRILVSLIIFISALAATLAVNPAHSQFLIQTQNALCSTFTANLGTGANNAGAGIKNIVMLVVGFVRGIILLVILGFAIAIGVQRDDKEQIRELVKTPVIILLATVVVDVLAVALVSSTGAASGTC
jgi:hypothetical protein